MQTRTSSPTAHDRSLFTGPLVADSAKPVPPPHQLNNITARKSRTHLRFSVLGSGSGGNSSVLQWAGRSMLIDAGFGPRTTARRLRAAGIDLADLTAVCVSHFDRDHFRPTWMAALLQYRIKLLLHRWHLGDFERLPGARLLGRAGLLHVFDSQPFEVMASLTGTAVRLPHDMKGTTGFLFESAGGRVGYATDLGHVPAELIHRFAGVDLLAIESNYDPQMQMQSGRPVFLKRRIMGGRGHLSNEQAFDAVRRIVDASPAGCPQHIVLLHRSRQCNCPYVVRRVFNQDPRIGPRVMLTEQRRRSRWLNLRVLAPMRRSQLKLGFDAESC